MTPRSVHEYLSVVAPRYRAAGREQKSRLLDEAERITGYHRKALLRLLRRRARPRRGRAGRPRRYDAAVAAALVEVWEASDQLCSKRLVPFLPELVTALERHGEIDLSPLVRERLLALSAATVDRLLAVHRRRAGRRPYTQRRAPSALQRAVPIRTFSEWQGVEPGACQADLVAHCGSSAAGFYLTTLLLVDVATGWVDLEPVWGHGVKRVKSGLHRIRQRLPFRLRELHTDNGGEFLNRALVLYCREEGIRLTRGRAYKKNDQAYVEQKNGSVVRRLVGYDRYSSRPALDQLEALYRPLRAYLNAFQPSQKLLDKHRHGARVTKRYDRAQTALQRLARLCPERRTSLETRYRNLNPVTLRTQIDDRLQMLWKLAQRPAAR